MDSLPVEIMRKRVHDSFSKPNVLLSWLGYDMVELGSMPTVALAKLLVHCGTDDALARSQGIAEKYA